MYQLTHPDDPEFSKEIADHINESNPGVATVRDGACFIKKKYYERCKAYVIANCNTK